jgi:hypothetical protein
LFRSSFKEKDIISHCHPEASFWRLSLGKFFFPDDRSGMSYQNIGTHLPNYTESSPKLLIIANPFLSPCINVTMSLFQQATFEAVSESIQIITEDRVLIMDFIHL